ncbi:MAG: hypothetical protein PHW76_08835 [Alphaproteobacteria bacterium]|nr:hypothetical protein [Alphaproteobacteria bacterium]
MVRAHSSDMETVSSLEQTSINALVAYTAYDRKVTEAVVRDVFMTHFGINGVNELPRASFEDAIRFLVDVQLDLMQ